MTIRGGREILTSIRANFQPFYFSQDFSLYSCVKEGVGFQSKLTQGRWVMTLFSLFFFRENLYDEVLVRELIFLIKFSQEFTLFHFMNKGVQFPISHEKEWL